MTASLAIATPSQSEEEVAVQDAMHVFREYLAVEEEAVRSPEEFDYERFDAVAISSELMLAA